MREIGDLDRRISILAEDVSRRLSRRQLVLKSVKTAVAATAAVTAGSLAGASRAFGGALACDCALPGCGNCSCRNKTCPSNGCPSGCMVCKTGDGCSQCNHNDGNWIACSGLGTCGLGYRLCWDCRCTGCGAKCGCKSVCLCCQCCSPSDVEAEMRSLASSA
jgi:hypothetical protein